MASSRFDAPTTDPELVISHKFPKTTFSYNERDVAIYALGIGACGGNAVDEKELKYVYHEDGQLHIQVLPTYVTLFPFHNKQDVGDVPSLQFDPRLLLHGQQYLEIYKKIPSSCCIENKVAIAGFHDKGKAAIIEIETISYEKESGEALCMNRSTIFLRGAGGFSRSKTPYSYSNYPQNQVSAIRIPECKPTAIFEDITQHFQALLYRLSGDYNPLHADPVVANIAGFNRPILHGLCSFGFAVRAVIKSFCNGEPSLVKGVFGRFLLHVYPGETLVTEMWTDGASSRVIFRTNVKERRKAVLTGYVLLSRIPASL